MSEEYMIHDGRAIRQGEFVSASTVRGLLSARDARIAELEARIRELTESNARLLAELGNASARIQELQEGNDMACESPPVGCDCPGCSLARELSRKCGLEASRELVRLESERDAALDRVKELEESLRKILAVKMDLRCTYCGTSVHSSPIAEWKGPETYEETIAAISAHDLICEKSPFNRRIAALESRIRELTEWRPMETAPDVFSTNLRGMPGIAERADPAHFQPNSYWFFGARHEELVCDGELPGWIPLPEAPRD